MEAMMNSCIRILLALIITFSAVAAKTADGSTALTSLKTVLAFGDSLTAGSGIMQQDKTFPAQLELELLKEGYAVKVINGGAGGDTTSSGLTRLPWALKQKPDYVIVELGANDMLRAIDPAVTKQNLEKILETFKKKKIPVLLAGMRATPNLGDKFVDSYRRMYQELAEHYGAVYYPFFLEGAVLKPELMQEDGLHPNEKGVAVIVERILPAMKKLLKK
jgi:acyl-CoA thioesterase-1